MGKVLKGMVVGGILGAAVGAVRASGRENDDGEAGADVARTAAGAALAGGFVGLILQRRAKRRAAARRLTVGSALTAGGIVEAARAVGPVLERAGEVAREAAAKAADTARPKVEQAVEAARPKIEQAADAARRRAAKAAEAARERASEVSGNGHVREIVLVR